MAYNDRELLARIIKCEAGGEGDSGMRAVASVVMSSKVNMALILVRIKIRTLRRARPLRGIVSCYPCALRAIKNMYVFNYGLV